MIFWEGGLILRVRGIIYFRKFMLPCFFFKDSDWSNQYLAKKDVLYYLHPLEGWLLSAILIAFCFLIEGIITLDQDHYAGIITIVSAIRDFMVISNLRLRGPSLSRLLSPTDDFEGSFLIRMKICGKHTKMIVTGGGWKRVGRVRWYFRQSESTAVDFS